MEPVEPMWPYGTTFVLMTARNAGSRCIFSDKFFILIAVHYSLEQAFTLENASEKRRAIDGGPKLCGVIIRQASTDPDKHDEVLYHVNSLQENSDFFGNFGMLFFYMIPKALRTTVVIHYRSNLLCYSRCCKMPCMI